jgi:hypothetical protein
VVTCLLLTGQRGQAQRQHQRLPLICKHLRHLELGQNLLELRLLVFAYGVVVVVAVAVGGLEPLQLDMVEQAAEAGQEQAFCLLLLV